MGPVLKPIPVPPPEVGMRYFGNDTWAAPGAWTLNRPWAMSHQISLACMGKGWLASSIQVERPSFADNMTVRFLCVYRR